MRAATCTPVDFDASEHFFARDSGLLCRGIQATGVECVVVMPGKRKQDDASDLVRCSEETLKDSAWWSSLHLDLVVLYAWGDPRYLAVARAIRSAGIYLIQSLDTAGLVTPYADFTCWTRVSRAKVAMADTTALRLKEIAKASRDLIPSLFEHRRLEMINESDAVAAVSPPAMESLAAYARALGYPEVAGKLIVVPHPVSPTMAFRGEFKQKRVVVVGRWGPEDAVQKDPQRTLEVLGRFLDRMPDWTAEVIGKYSATHAHLTSHWSRETRDRIKLTDFLEHAALHERYTTSSIILCASRFESFHIASAEAVCCGCSVVLGAHPLLGSTAWFTTLDSGTLAPSRSSNNLVEALIRESECWDAGERSGENIAFAWAQRLHAPIMAAELLRATTEKTPDAFSPH